MLVILSLYPKFKAIERIQPQALKTKEKFVEQYIRSTCEGAEEWAEMLGADGGARGMWRECRFRGFGVCRVSKGF